MRYSTITGKMVAPKKRRKPDIGPYGTLDASGPRPIGRISTEFRLFNLGSMAATAHVIAAVAPRSVSMSKSSRIANVSPPDGGCARTTLRQGEKGRLSVQHRNGGRVSRWQGTNSTGTDVSSLRGGIAGPRSHSSTIFWLDSSSTILERFFHGMKAEKVELAPRPG